MAAKEVKFSVEARDKLFSGGVIEWDTPAFKVKGPNITPNPTGGLGKWSAGDLGTLLKLGMTPDGDFVGSEMAKVVNNSTSKLPDADIAATLHDRALWHEGRAVWLGDEVEPTASGFRVVHRPSGGKCGNHSCPSCEVIFIASPPDRGATQMSLAYTKVTWVREMLGNRRSFVSRARAERGAAVLSEPITAIYTAQVHTVTPQTPVEEVMRIMTEHRVRHAPVVVDGGLRGIVSIGDVVKNRIDELETERAHLTNYITGSR